MDNPESQELSKFELNKRQDAEAGRFKPSIKQHVQAILINDFDVVIDIPPTTKIQRKWFNELCNGIDCGYEMMFINKSNDNCIEQLGTRCNEHLNIVLLEDDLSDFM